MCSPTTSNSHAASVSSPSAACTKRTGALPASSAPSAAGALVKWSAPRRFTGAFSRSVPPFGSSKGTLGGGNIMVGGYGGTTQAAVGSRFRSRLTSLDASTLPLSLWMALNTASGACHECASGSLPGTNSGLCSPYSTGSSGSVSAASIAKTLASSASLKPLTFTSTTIVSGSSCGSSVTFASILDGSIPFALAMLASMSFISSA
mmetsp:Transcript_17515/g.45586  ORF Transcript_17515/g.45586 Transcript_17515/m.45586 type:complete len:205 (-) Transcript_17515:627-1241(-)